MEGWRGWRVGGDASLGIITQFAIHLLSGDLQSLYIHLLIIHMHQEMMQRHISHFRRSRRYSSPGERINEEQQQQHT